MSSTKSMNNIMVLGAGGVGTVVAKGLQRIPAVDSILVADLSLERAETLVQTLQDPRAHAMKVNAADSAAVAKAIQGCKIVIHAGIPRFNPFVMEACLQAGSHYIDMASDGPVDIPGVVTVQSQLAYNERFKEKGLLALLCIGSDPGVTNILARYAYDRMKTVEDIVIYDGDNVTVRDYPFAITFSPETSIEECLQTPLTYENGHFVTGKALETGIEVFNFPEPVGQLTVRSVSHEEVGTLPLFLNQKGLKRCEFKYALSQQYVDILKALQTVGLDREETVKVGDSAVVPRKVVVSLLPQPSELSESMDGSSCVGTWVKGTDMDGMPLEMYMYTIQDNDHSRQDMGANITAFQAGIPPVVAVEMILDGTIQEIGTVSPEQLDPEPWIQRLPKWGMPLHIRKTSHTQLKVSSWEHVNRPEVVSVSASATKGATGAADLEEMDEADEMAVKIG